MKGSLLVACVAVILGTGISPAAQSSDRVALASTNEACPPSSTQGGWSLSMTALNAAQPFASEAFARQVARLVLADRYPRDSFTPAGDGAVADEGDAWAVTFGNALLADDAEPYPVKPGFLVPQTLTFVIRKADAAVMDIR